MQAMSATSPRQHELVILKSGDEALRAFDGIRAFDIETDAEPLAVK